MRGPRSRHLVADTHAGSNLTVACFGDGTDGQRRCPQVGEELLGAIGYLQSYAPEMGDAKVTCDGGCSCDGHDPLKGWHKARTSVTWVSWIVAADPLAARDRRQRVPVHRAPDDAATAR